MKFNPGDGSGIVDEIDDLCDSDSTSYPIAKKTRRVNSFLERVIAWIIGADGTWQFDDTNFTNVPIGVADLVEGQSSYSFQEDFLDILTVKIKDQNGHWHLIDPIDQKEVNYALEDDLAVNGFPTKYDKNSDTIKVYPAPTASVVTLSGGLKVEFQRTASLFTTADTIKEPGFASPFHIVLPYMAALPYCATYKKDRVEWLMAQIGDNPEGMLPSGLKRDIINFYARREKDTRKVMTMKPIKFR